MGSIEHRSHQNHRREDVGPPAGSDERRARTERRMPQVAERLLSDAEWRSSVDRQAGTRMSYVMELRERPTNIPGRLWEDF